MKAHNADNEVIITIERITLRFGDMEPVIIPRSSLRTRLQLIEWIYRLTGWPGMNLPRMRRFIEAIFRHHGWGLPDPMDDSLLATMPVDNTTAPLNEACPNRSLSETPTR